MSQNEKLYNLLSGDKPLDEGWKPIDKIYQVSNLGRVKTVDYTLLHPKNGKRKMKGKILKSGNSGSGYLQVSIHRNNVSLIKILEKDQIKLDLGESVFYTFNQNQLHC